MTVTDKDKIALLEFLGYETEGKLFKDVSDWWRDLYHFNPLDISILTKALDILIKTYNVFYIVSGGCHPNSGCTYSCELRFNNGKQVLFYTKSIEEAILKAILEYIKTIEK